MIDEQWDRFVMYVNAYYAVQEAYDSARRSWERPAEGLELFCRDANPFLWDGEGSAEPELYEEFCRMYDQRHGSQPCTPAEGRDLARTWLASLEGDAYGTALVASLDQIADERAWRESCEPISRQIAARRARIERTPQEQPAVIEPAPAHQPSQADIDAVIALLSKGDDDFAAQLRARLADEPRGA